MDEGEFRCEGVDEYDEAKLVKTMPSHFGSFILSHSKRLMNHVIKQRSGFFNSSIHYTDTDSLYIHKKNWSDLADIGFVGKSLGKNNYGTSGILYSWILAPKIKFCLVTDDFGVILAKRTFKGHSEEHRKIKLNKYISLTEGKIASGRFSIDWTETFERIKIPHRKQVCLDCDDGKVCCDCVIKP